MLWDGVYHICTGMSFLDKNVQIAKRWRKEEKTVRFLMATVRPRDLIQNRESTYNIKSLNSTSKMEKDVKDIYSGAITVSIRFESAGVDRK